MDIRIIFGGCILIKLINQLLVFDLVPSVLFLQTHLIIEKFPFLSQIVTI
jgi:hypothetical protein